MEPKDIHSIDVAAFVKMVELIVLVIAVSRLMRAQILPSESIASNPSGMISSASYVSE